MANKIIKKETSSIVPDLKPGDIVFFMPIPRRKDDKTVVAMVTHLCLFGSGHYSFLDLSTGYILSTSTKDILSVLDAGKFRIENVISNATITIE